MSAVAIKCLKKIHVQQSQHQLITKEYEVMKGGDDVAQTIPS